MMRIQMDDMISEQKQIYHNIRNHIQKKMQKEPRDSRIQFSVKKRNAISNDLRHRLFEIGLNQSPKKNINPLLNSQIGSPKSKKMAKHPLINFNKQNSSMLLKYQPSQSPQLAKTHGKQFHIRKNIKLPFSPKTPSSPNTISSFFPEASRINQNDLHDSLHQMKDFNDHSDPCLEIRDHSSSKLDQYVGLILKGVDKIQEFLYLVRGSDQNIYELELVNFEKVRAHEGDPNFEYYTVSKKGFCKYVGGKPQNFLEILEWAQEKDIYTKIKSLKFFYRFRRWKTLQMWRTTVTRQRRESIANNLQEKLFYLEPTSRKTLLELRKLTIEMEKSVLIIARNEGTYSLQSFKHCQERARRQTSLAVEEYSREARSVVRKCFDSRLTELRENIKKSTGQDKQSSPSISASQSPKESAFQALGFPSKMSYQHRSKLRKQTGKFLRFSYLVDNIHLSCLAELYSTQVQAFITRLQQLQMQEPIRLRKTVEETKDELNNSERMFALQLTSNFKEVPERLISKIQNSQGFKPIRDIKLKNQEEEPSLWVFRLAQYWLTMQPNIEQVLDELTFLLREGLASLKCFQRWSKHRQMQKYVSILQEWDDLVSEHWQISENDNLDPMLIIDNLDPILSRLKNILRVTETKFEDSIRNILTSLLNAYWEYQRLDLEKLQNLQLLNPAETFQNFLIYTTQQLEKATLELPHRIELGIIVLHVTKVKNIIGQKFANIIEKMKIKLPELVDQRTSALNQWLSNYGTRLREQILNIDDYVRTANVIKEAEADFAQKRDECGELSSMYQTMQQFKMDTRKRKDFQSVTLKLKDQLDQLLISAEQNIERKADLYTKEVIKYHLPNLLKDITKTLETVEQPRFLKLDADRSTILEDLGKLKVREQELIEDNQKCSCYMEALKLTHQPSQTLVQLSQQIKDRVTLWETLGRWEEFTKGYQEETIKSIQLALLIQEVEDYKQITEELQKSLPPNEVLTFLRQKVEEYYVNLPLLIGFSSNLSESHWFQIYQTLPQDLELDLKKRQFTLQQFLLSKIGVYAKQIQHIFEKSRVEAKLQQQYQRLQEQWNNLTAKIKVEGKFNHIANGQVLRSDLNTILTYLTEILADPHSQSLKQYSITYDSLLNSQILLDQWIQIQERLSQLEKLCKLLDIKKLPDYSYFQSAQRIYKQISKLALIKGSESGVKLGRLLNATSEDKMAEIDQNLLKVEDVIKNIVGQHRKAYPSFYLCSDEMLIKLITEGAHEDIQKVAKMMIPGLKSLQFQNERIISLVTIDDQKLIKNQISTNAQIEQILHQITETMSEIHRRTMRNCRYKAIENNLTSMVQGYNIQYLLAISRVDFSNYTTISIQNQQETPQSLAQFRKVMRKDTAEDIRNRQFMRENGLTSKDIKNNTIYTQKVNIQKYDALLLQQLVYEEILDQLIRNNIQRAEQFTWAAQLKFYWEDVSTDETNITVRQLHVNMKYGNEFLGSLTKVIIQNEAELLLGMKMSEPVVYAGGRYVLERLFNAVGYKMLPMYCSPQSTFKEIYNFSIGCYYADYLPLLCSADLLPTSLKYNINYHFWVNEFKTLHLKKNSPYVKDTDKSSTLFALLRDETSAWSFGKSFRVVSYRPPSSEVMKSGMQMLGIFSGEKNNLLLRIFQTMRFLEKRSQLQGVSLEKFLDLVLKEESNPDEHVLFSKLLTYLKPCIAIETHKALTKHLQTLGLVAINSEKMLEMSKMGEMVECLWERGVMILSGKGQSKKHFLQEELLRQKVQFISICGKNLVSSQLFSQTFLEELLSQYPTNQKSVFYIEHVTSDIVLAIQKLLYHSNFFQHFQKKVSFVLDIPLLDKFVDPHIIGSLPVFNFEQPKHHIQSLLEKWTGQHLEEDKQKQLLKVIQEVVIPCFQSLNSREDLVIETKIIQFFKYLGSVLPVHNLLQASIYCLALMYRGQEDELLKLEYLTKKQLSDEYFADDTKIHQLMYCKNIPKQSLMSESQHLKNWIEEFAFRDEEYVMTPEYVHLLVAARRVHDGTGLGVALEGRGNSGKSTFLQLYRQLNHQNSFYLKISSKNSKNWNGKIEKTLQSHGINMLGARINYKQTIIMVEDVHMAPKESFQPLHSILKYKRWRKQSLSQDSSLKNIKMIMTGRQIPEELEENVVKLHLGTDCDKLKAIFSQLLKQNIGMEWNVSTQFINKIAYGSFDLCCKMTNETYEQIQEGFTPLRRILMGFAMLKSKDMNNPMKDLQKYWTYALQQALHSHNTNKKLEQQLKMLELSTLNQSTYTHLSGKLLEKRIQSVRDVKRLFNMLNQRIEKYNEGQTKRYGENFQFINFDNLLDKVLSISHSIVVEQDHLLFGRKGAGKESLVKLSAFFNGLHYKYVSGNIKVQLMELFEAVASTPHLLLKKITNKEDIQSLWQYCHIDFQSEILGQCESKPRTGKVEKEKVQHSAMINKTTRKDISLHNDVYIMPKSKPCWNDIISQKKSYKLVIAINNKDILLSLDKNIRKNFHFDIMSEVPTSSLVQYNEKLLAVDEIQCSKDAQILISQIFQYSRQKLGVSLRGNDDCVRLFSSFIGNLIPEMTMESQRFEKILKLLEKLRQSNAVINADLSECHARMKELSQAEALKEEKAEVEMELREKSTALAVNQKISEIMGWLEPSYSKKYEKYQKLLQNRNNLQLIFALTASYFIFLSNQSYNFRRNVLQQWYSNIPAMSQLPQLDSFLPLFLLYEEQFNAEPVDDLPDFYQNMAIIFHSAKPIAIQDKCERGRFWLQKNCSFVHMKEDQKQFMEMLSQNLTKPTNILIEVVNQETIDNINDSIIGTLLFLPENITSVNIKGEDVVVHQEAKVYMLLGPNVILTKAIQAQFTVVVYEENAEISKRAITNEYHCWLQRDHQFSKLDLHKKMRTLKLECETVMTQVAQSLYQQLYPEEEEVGQSSLVENLSKINDKLMIKAQNQFTKVKEKEDVDRDLKEKYDIVSAKIEVNLGLQFNAVADKVLKIMKYMQERTGKNYKVDYACFFKCIRFGLQHTIIKDIGSLLLFALRQWGPLFKQQQYSIFAFLLVMAYHKKEPQVFAPLFTPQNILSGEILTLINRPVVPILHQETFEFEITEAFIQIFRDQQFISIPALIKYKEPMYEPILWVQSECEPVPRTIEILSQMGVSQIRDKLMADNPRIIEPSQEDSLESLLKKHQEQTRYVLVFNKSGQEECERILKHYNLRQSTVIITNQSTPKMKGEVWGVELENAQRIFKDVVASYFSEVMLFDLGALGAPEEALVQVQKQEEEVVRDESPRHSHHSALQPQNQPDMQNDKYMQFAQTLTKSIKKMFSDLELPQPIFSKVEILHLRKSIENNDWPLSHQEKINCIIKYISFSIQNIPEKLSVLLESKYGKILKMAQKDKQEEFFNEVKSVIGECKEEDGSTDKKIEVMTMEMGWISRIWHFLGKNYEELNQNYVQQLQRLLSVYETSRDRPQISRNSKRQINVRQSRTANMIKKDLPKRSRDSISSRKGLKLLLPSKTSNSQLATIHLLKQSQFYGNILNQIFKDIQNSKVQVENYHTPPDRQILENVIVMMKGKPIESWKNMLESAGVGQMSLEAAITNLILRRNELYTLYSKFTVNDSYEIDMRFMRKPEDFLRSYFGTSFGGRQTFVLTSQLCPEQAERCEYLRLVGLWSSGWRISSEGSVEHLGEGKTVQMGGCFLVKRVVEGLGFCPVDVFTSAGTASFMKLNVVSKKMFGGLKLFIHNEQ